MSKRESTFLNMTLTLFAVTLIASFGVGYVYEITKGPIAQSQLEKKTKALRQVLPEFNNDPVAEQSVLDVDGDQLIFFPAKKDGAVVGTAVETFTNQGFADQIRLMVGFTPAGKIINIAVLTHKETPGLGDKIDEKKSDFSRQFKDKNPARYLLSVTKDGGDVDAITAATISSRAFCDAVKRAYDHFQKDSIQ